jgi:hypothetical protein
MLQKTEAPESPTSTHSASVKIKKNVLLTLEKEEELRLWH